MSARRPTLAGYSLLVVCAVAAPAAIAAVSCTASATGPAFGTYSPLSVSPLAANANVTVNCTLLSGGATTVNATLSLSAGASGSFATRTMLSGATRLNYNLYQSAAYAQVWGDGTGGSFTGMASLRLTPANRTQAVTKVAYGRIPALQDIGAGAYLDTIVVTVAY